MQHAIKAAHLSLKWSAHPGTVADYIADVIARNDDLELVTTTESKGRARAVRRKLGRKWRVQARGEFLVISRRSTLGRWRLWPSRTRRAHGADWSNGPHAGTRHFEAIFANLKYRASGQRVRVMVTHSTSGVQVGEHWRAEPSRVEPAKRGLNQLGHWVARCSDDVIQVVAMDSNLEQHLAVWREYLEDELGLPSIWHDTRPPRGTEGHRLIDTAHTNAQVDDQGLEGGHRPPIIDHGGIVFTLIF